MSEDRAEKISGLIEAKVLFLSSVPYLCLMRVGRAGLMRWGHNHTMVFSRVDVSSSSSCRAVPWCCIWTPADSRLSFKKEAIL